MIRSLRSRLMVGAAILVVLFMSALRPALQSAFSQTMIGVIEQRLAADANTLITAARLENGRLLMPDRLPDEEFNLPEARLLGLIFDRYGQLIWRSQSALDEQIIYRPRYFHGESSEFIRARNGLDEEFFVYDIELLLSDNDSDLYSFVTMLPARDHDRTLKVFRNKLYLWLGSGFLVLLGLLWLGLTWGFRSLRQLSIELDQVESGQRARLSDEHPKELLRLTDSLNHLLDSERRQRERYQNSLEDLAHSLKTPLSVLQGISEVVAGQEDSREQGALMHAQIERMSQQIGYQLQRASLRRSGLVRHRVILQPLLESLCTSLGKVYRDKRVRIVLDVPAGGYVAMEQGALLELLGNLLENAYRLCLGTVKVSLSVSGGSCLLSVEDDGPGVPREQRALIIKRGERLDTLNPGQGIGLAVVQDIIDSYDGELTLDDSSLGGAAFHVRLPRF